MTREPRDSSETGVPDEVENARLLARDAALYGTTFTDVTGRRIDPAMVRPAGEGLRDMIVADPRMPADRVAVVMPRMPGPDEPDASRGARFHVLNMGLSADGEARAFGFLDFALAHVHDRGGVGSAIPGVLAEPCAYCRTEEPCRCRVAGLPCQCSCGRCRFPGVLPDDGPQAERASDERAAANGMGC